MFQRQEKHVSASYLFMTKRSPKAKTVNRGSWKPRTMAFNCSGTARPGWNIPNSKVSLYHLELQRMGFFRRGAMFHMTIDSMKVGDGCDRLPAYLSLRIWHVWGMRPKMPQEKSRFRKPQLPSENLELLKTLPLPKRSCKYHLSELRCTIASAEQNDFNKSTA